MPAWQHVRHDSVTMSIKGASLPPGWGEGRVSGLVEQILERSTFLMERRSARNWRGEPNVVAGVAHSAVKNSGSMRDFHRAAVAPAVPLALQLPGNTIAGLGELMPEIMTRCPTFGKAVRTGLRTETIIFESIEDLCGHLAGGRKIHHRIAPTAIMPSTTKIECSSMHRYAFPSVAISRNSRHATQTPSVSSSGAAFSPNAVLTLTTPFSTAHDPPIARPSNAVVISFQIICGFTARLPAGSKRKKVKHGRGMLSVIGVT